MVHVSDAGGRHKMLAFTTNPEPTFTGIDSIIKVTKEVVTFNDSSSSPASTTSNHSSNNTTAPTPTTEFNNLHNNSVIGFTHHSHQQTNGKLANNLLASSPPSQFVPKTILKNTHNSFQDKSTSDKSSPKYRLSDKMFSEEDTANNLVAANNNANYLADTINSNSNNIMQSTTTLSSPSTATNLHGGGGNNMNYDHHDLQLISHGLTDSVCETIKLLENEYDNGKSASHNTATSAASLSSGVSASSSSTSGGLGVGIDDHHISNVVYTEEIVISTAKSNSSAVTGVQKPGIMKTFSSFSSTPSNTNAGTGGCRNKVLSSTEHWKNQLNEECEDEEAMSQSNESEETPLLTVAEQSSDTHQHNVSTVGSDNISNESPGAAGGSAGGAPSSVLHKMGKMTNGTKTTGLKRVSFGSSKGSMVETLIYESPVSDEPGKAGKAGALPILANGASRSSRGSDGAAQNSPDSTASGGSTGGSRPPSRVRVTFFESEKPLAVSSPESDILDFDLSKMTIHGSPTVNDHSSPTYNRQISVEGWDNPFRPDGDLSKEADQIVELIKEGKPINDETLRSKSPSVNETMNTSTSIPTQNQLNASPKGKEVNGSATNGTSGPVDIQHTVVTPAAQAGQVEHVVLKKKKGCCVIQ